MSISAGAKDAAAGITDGLRDVTKLPEFIQGFVKTAVEKSDDGIDGLITSIVSMPQTPQTAGKSDGFKAEVGAVLKAGDFRDILNAQFPGIDPPAAREVNKYYDLPIRSATGVPPPTRRRLHCADECWPRRGN